MCVDPYLSNRFYTPTEKRFYLKKDESGLFNLYGGSAEDSYSTSLSLRVFSPTADSFPGPDAPSFLPEIEVFTIESSIQLGKNFIITSTLFSQ